MKKDGVSLRIQIEDRGFKVCKPGDEKTNPELAELLTAFAQASWSWTHTENSLFLVFAHITEPNSNNHTKALRAAFFSIVSPAARLDMINAVINATWEKDSVKDWTPLYAECRAQLSIRGRLAHLAGHSYKKRDGKVHAVMMDPIHHPNTKRTHAEANSIEFTTKRLNELAAKWITLRDRLMVFVALVSLQNKPEADSQLANDLRKLLVDPDIQKRQR